MSRLDEFRVFVRKYPQLAIAVESKKTSWQEIYERWVLYGEAEDVWVEYSARQSEEKSNQLGLDGVKNILNNLKKIDPNKVNNTLNSVQKVIQIAQSVAGPKLPSTNITNAFSDWWD